MMELIISAFATNFILLIVIILLLFNKEISALLYKPAAPAKRPSNDIDSIKKYEQDNPKVPPHILHFTTGQHNAIILVKLALYEMYRDNELLDYQSIIDSVSRYMKRYDDQSYVDKVSRELDSYVKNKSTHDPYMGERT